MRKKNVNRRSRPAKEAKNFLKKAATAVAMGPIILFAAPTNSLDTSVLATQLMDYYRAHRDLIHNELEIGLFDGPHDVQRNFTMIPLEVDQLVLSEAVVDDFIHQHVPGSTSTFNPKANVITPQTRTLYMRDYEGDLQFTDKEIERTYLTYLGKMKMLAKSDSPDKTQQFVEYLFWESIIKKAKRTLRKALFQAAYDNTGTYDYIKILDGWEQLILDATTNGDITPVSLGSITKSNVIDKVESVFDTLDEAVQGADDLVCALSPSVYKLWIRADRAANGRTSTFDSKGTFTIDGYSNCTVIEEPDFNSTKVAIYRKNNPVVSASNNEGAWEFQRADRLTKMMLNGKIGLQFTSINPNGKINVAIGK